LHRGAIHYHARPACDASTSPAGCRLAATERKRIAVNPDVTEIYKDPEILFFFRIRSRDPNQL
jgi:hypothetical protein